VTLSCELLLSRHTIVVYSLRRHHEVVRLPEFVSYYTLATHHRTVVYSLRRSTP
jgi:hypothetical protein